MTSFRWLVLNLVCMGFLHSRTPDLVKINYNWNPAFLSIQTDYF